MGLRLFVTHTTWHFEGWNCISQVASHYCKAFRSSWSKVASWTFQWDDILLYMYSTLLISYHSRWWMFGWYSICSSMSTDFVCFRKSIRAFRQHTSFVWIYSQLQIPGLDVSSWSTYCKNSFSQAIFYLHGLKCSWEISVSVGKLWMWNVVNT